MAGPAPPPHSKSSPLPTGNYDIFVIPPHSAGSGFLYLPSLKPNINSFIAGFSTALLGVCIWNVLVPAFRHTLASLNSGASVLLLLIAFGAAYQFGHRPGEAGGPSGTGTKFTWGSGGGSATSASSSWEKAKDETRRREQERKRAADATNTSNPAEKAARAAAEKEKWEQARAREKDSREREARERIAKERAQRTAGAKNYQKPTAQSVGPESDYYAHYKRPSAASAGSSAEEHEYAPSMSTARSTPPPASKAERGPYRTADPNKIVIAGVYLFKTGATKPSSMLITEQGGLTDGLVLRITTEGLFIDDDVRGVPQREWDVKAWGIKLVETGTLDNITVFRASLRDTEQKRYLFVIAKEQSFKVDLGLERLRKGSQVRSLGMNGIKEPEMKSILTGLGWV